VNKKIIFIAFMVLILAALGLALFLLNREPPAAAPEVSAQVRYIFNAGEETGAAAGRNPAGDTGGPAPLSVTVQNDSGEYTLIPGAKPLVAGLEDVPLDPRSLNRIAGAAEKMVSRGIAAEDAADPAIFGLAPPRARITIRPRRGGEIVLLIGAGAPDGGSVYVKTEAAPAVHLASSGDIELMLRDPLDFADTLITAPAEQEKGAALFEQIILGGTVRGDAPVKIEPRETRAPAGLPGMPANPWRISSPVDADLSLDRGLPPLESLFGLRAARVAARIKSGAEPGRFGLAEPWSTAAVSGGTGNFVLMASAPDAAGNVYILKEGVPLIYQVPASTLPWLELSWFDLMDKLVIVPFIDRVSLVEVKTPERTLGFSLSGEGDALTVKAGDAPVDTAAFRAYYQILLTARYDEYSDVSPAALSAPFLEIVYHYRDGRAADAVGFYRASSRRVLTSLNRGRPYYMFSAYADKVIADLDLVLKGEKVRTYL
jgi:hypothetical protein